MKRKEKIVKSNKVLKNTKNMRFIKRIIILDNNNKIQEIRDYFFHEIEQITLRRDTHYFKIPNRADHYVHWTCEELDNSIFLPNATFSQNHGTAGIGYWLRMSRQNKQHLKKNKNNE